MGYGETLVMLIVNIMYQLSAKLAQNYQVTALVVTGRPISVEAFRHDMKLPFVYSEVCKVHYPIHLFTFVIVGGGVMPDPPGVLHRALTEGGLII